jgi:hypothetical protein
MFGAALNPRSPRNVLQAIGGAQSADSPPSRRDKAFAAIEGREPGLLSLNPWVPIFDFDDSTINSVAAHGGLVLTFQLSDPISFSDNNRVAMLWDDEVLADGPKIVRQGDRFVMTVPEVKGARLSLWCDSALAASLKDTQPLSQQSAVLQREADLKKVQDAQSGKLVGGIFDSFFKANAAVGIAVVVVAGLVGYAWLKGK